MEGDEVSDVEDVASVVRGVVDAHKRLELVDEGLPVRREGPILAYAAARCPDDHHVPHDEPIV